MTKNTFRAFLVRKTDDNQFIKQVVEQDFEDLPPGDVLIRVHYSSLNYKDALSATGHPGVTKKFPHVPGIDAAGIVVSSPESRFQKDQPVLVTGFDLGMNTWGGFSEYIRVPADWVIPLPVGLTLKESMMLGTAGLTAALCVDAIIKHEIVPASGEVLVTGSTGGVGSIAVSILSKLGYTVVAVTGKSESHNFLKSLGAQSIIGRDEIADKSGRMLLTERWGGAVDTVGGTMLATILKSTKYGGCVTACGLVGGANLPTSVYPFILRGVSLIGIDSVRCSISERLQIWSKLARDWKPEKLEEIASTISLRELPEAIDKILQGGNLGRVAIALHDW